MKYEIIINPYNKITSNKQVTKLQLILNIQLVLKFKHWYD